MYKEVTVANPLRLVLLAALTAFVVSFLPTTGSAIAPERHHAMHCMNSKECPAGFHCQPLGHTFHGKTGICVKR